MESLESDFSCVLPSASLGAEGLYLDFPGRACQACSATLIRSVSDVSLDDPFLPGALESDADSEVTWLDAESLSTAMAFSCLRQPWAGFF